MEPTPTVKPFIRIHDEDTGKTKWFLSWQWQVILTSMIGYSIFYFVRKNFAFAMPALGAEYGITNKSFGIILSLVGIIYGISKFLNGIIADRANARWHFAIGLSASVVINFLFGWTADLSHWITGQESGPDFINAFVMAMAVLLVVNNIAQGSGFAPCNRLLVHWIPPKELASKLSVWNTAHSVGGALVSILCGSIIGGMGVNLSSDTSVVARIAGNLGKDVTDPAVIRAAEHVGAWQWCFWIPAFIGLAGVVLMWFSVRDTPKSVGLPELEGTHTEMDDNDTAAGYKEFVSKMVFKNPVIWMLAIADLFVYVVRFAIFDWGPKFMTQGAQAFTPKQAGWAVACFEIFGIIGMVVSGFVTDKLFKSKGQRVSAIWMGATAGALLLLWALPKSWGFIPYCIGLGLVGFILYGPQTLAGVTAANMATKKAASAAVGLVGLVSYGANLFTGIGIGSCADRFGDAFWSALFPILAVVSLIGALFFALTWNAKNGYERANEIKP